MPQWTTILGVGSTTTLSSTLSTREQEVQLNLDQDLQEELLLGVSLQYIVSQSLDVLIVVHWRK